MTTLGINSTAVIDGGEICVGLIRDAVLCLGTQQGRCQGHLWLANFWLIDWLMEVFLRSSWTFRVYQCTVCFWTVIVFRPGNVVGWYRCWVGMMLVWRIAKHTWPIMFWSLTMNKSFLGGLVMPWTANALSTHHHKASLWQSTQWFFCCLFFNWSILGCKLEV